MIKYTIFLKLKDSQNPDEEYPYTLSLTSHQENNPDKIFTSEIRESMRTNLQNQSSCKISDNHLNQMIKSWIEDIQEGYRETILTLDLPLMIAEQFNQLHESGYQQIPPLIAPDLSGIEPAIGFLPPLRF
jgi:hypothetical protein